MRRAIALLITLMFVMVISVAIGYGLTQLKKASKIVQDEDILYKSTMVLSDILEILKTAPQINQLADANASDELYIFLQTAQSLPLDIANEKVVVSFKSANSKININMLNKNNEALFRNFFNRYMVGSSYIDIVKECMRNNQAKDEYNNSFSSLFDANPTLFRQYIASKEHLEKINTFYIAEYGDTNLKNIPFDELFCYSADQNQTIDLNYVSAVAWEMILDTSAERAEELFLGEGSYKSLDDLNLTPQEKVNISKFKTTFFAPYILVDIELIHKESISKIRFIYDIKLQRGYDFVFEV